MNLLDDAEHWPELPFTQIAPTAETLHLWTQIVGKVRLARAPWLNHSWHATLYVSARGLTTALIPYQGGGLEQEFDFLASELSVRATTGGERRLPLRAGRICDFYADVVGALTSLGTPVVIDPRPNEAARCNTVRGRST